LAVKIVRQVKNIALLGAPTSAAGLGAGQEGAPAALRSAGLAERLTAAGFQVTDHGDCAPRVYKPDDEHPRARNATEALAIIEELRPKVEAAVKSGALAVILAGDDTMVLAAIAGSRRYYRHVSVISVDRDAGLNVPATTPSGCLDGMVISHIVGRGAPELVRFWGEPPLIREPDVAVFGIDRVDQPEQKWLGGSPLQHYLAVDIKRRGAAVAAQEALERVHGSRHEFVLLLDLDAIAAEDFAATNFPGSGGLTLDDIRQAVGVFARQPTLVAFVIAGYNPARDTDGKAAKIAVDLLEGVLAPRLQAPAPEATEATAASSGDTPAAETAQPEGPAEAQTVEPQVEEATTVVPSAAPDPAGPAAASAESAAPEKPSEALSESEPPAE
jgi:arginase